MKAALLRSPTDIVIEEVPMPIFSKDQVLVQISHMGICGTDLKIFNGDIPYKKHWQLFFNIKCYIYISNIVYFSKFIEKCSD